MGANGSKGGDGGDGGDSTPFKPISMDDPKIKAYRLQHPGSCTGMFWRGDPNRKVDKVGGDDWPKNGAVLYGLKRKVNKDEYLEVAQWQQANGGEMRRNCEGLWMPFKQGGQLLHQIGK